MKNYNLTKGFVLAILLVLLPITGCAGNGKGDRKGPPPEAIRACEGKQVGDVVSFTGRQGEAVKAFCRSLEDGKIAAVPEGHEPPEK